MSDDLNVLPGPLTPADCNLRGFPWMALDTVRLLDSDLFLLATGDEFKAALALWCKSWSQVPAASLPNDDRLLAALSGSKAWKKVKAVAMRGWILCSDDRWYHPVVAEKALEALPARKHHAEQKAASTERKERERADRKRLFELLRESGVVPEFTTTTTKLRELAQPFVDRDKSQPVTRDMSHAVTAKTGQDRTEQNSTFNSVPKGTGAVGAVAPSVPATVMTNTELANAYVKEGSLLSVTGAVRAEADSKVLWRAGKALLWLHGGLDNVASGKLLGKLRKDHGDVIVLDMLTAACVERPQGPQSWMQATCLSKAGKRPAANRQEAQEARNHAAADSWVAEQMAKAAENDVDNDEQHPLKTGTDQ